MSEETNIEPITTRRTLSIEHLERMRAGREKARQKKAEREARRAEREARKAEPQTEDGRLPDNGPRPVVRPFAFARPEPQDAPTGRIPRLVKMAEVGELIDRFWPLILDWYPEARREMVKPRLTLATRGVTDRLYRTDNGLAFFEMRQTAFESLPVVHTIFVVGDDKRALLDAGEEWASQIGAVRFDGARDNGAKVWSVDLRERKALSSA